MVFDTHIFVRWILNVGITAARLEIVASVPLEQRWVSAITLIEVAQLVAKGRIQLDRPVGEWLRSPFDRGEFTLVPISPEIAQEAYALPGNFHKDPADRIIVATARALDCELITDDDLIRRYPHVRTV